MPFDSEDIIRQSGYQTGDVLTLAAIPPSNANAVTTSSSSFVTAQQAHRIDWQWDRLIPDGATGLVTMSAGMEPGTDETYDIRMRNIDDSETLVSISQSGSTTKRHPDWIEYSPATTASPIRVAFQHKTDPGDVSSTSRTPVFYLGAQL